MSNVVTATEHARVVAENQALCGQLDGLRRQLAWLKRQLFGEKSERYRVLEPGVQASLFEGSVFDISFAAGILVDTFCYHLPLYRQHQRLAHNGIQVARSSLSAVVARTSALLELIAQAQLTHVLDGGVLAMDETPIKAGRKGRGQMQQAHFWRLYGEADEIRFTFSRSRAGAHIERTLGDRVHGVLLLTDRYAAYEKYAAGQPRITHAQCWSHMRRGFERALGTDPAAATALEHIGAVYAQEQSIREHGLEREAKCHARRERCGPLVRAFWRGCDELLHHTELEPCPIPMGKQLVVLLERGRCRACGHDPDPAGDLPAPGGRPDHLCARTSTDRHHLSPAPVPWTGPGAMHGLRRLLNAN